MSFAGSNKVSRHSGEREDLGNARDDAEQFEDGEIKVFDNENYILSDSYFRF